MFKKVFTKKDKRTNLEKEIDSVLDLMSNIKPDPKEDSRTNLDKAIDSTLEAMSNVAPESDDYDNMAKTLAGLYQAKANDISKLGTYSEMADNLEKLYKAKANEKDRRVSPDTIAVVAANLLGIALILWHEKANVITSKALGFVFKGRV